MGDIIDKVIIYTPKKEKVVDILFDTGADIGRITKDLVDEIGLTLVAKNQKFSGGDGVEYRSDVVAGMVDIKGCRYPVFFALSKKEKPTKATIGRYTMQSMGIQLDPQNESYTVRCNIPEL